MIFNKYRLEDITDKIGDGIHGTPEYDDNGDYYFVNGNNLMDGDIVFKKDTKRINEEQYLKNKRDLNKNTLLVSINGTLGNVAKYNNEKIILGKSACYMNVKDEYNVDYVYFVFESPEFKKYLQYGANGTTIKNVPLSAIRNYEISIPSKENQDKIVRILKSIEDKIKLNNKINNNLYELCNNLFHEYLDKYESKVEYKKIVEIAKKVVTGKTPSTANKDFWDGDIPFITIPDMHNQVFTIKTERNITELGAKSIIPKNSISVSCIATVGLVSINTEDSQTNQQINSIVIENDYDLYFLFEYLSEQEEYMKSIAGGSTTYNINKNTFENIEVPYLPKDVLIEFNNSVSSMFEKIKLNQYENERLSQLRDTLLPKLMNGEMDLDNVEI